MRFKKDKVILLFFIILGISYSFVLIYFDSTIPRPPSLNEVAFRTLTQTKIIEIDPIKIFNLMSDISNYPLIIPEYVSSVEIINQTNTEKFVIMKIHAQGITDELLVKHSVNPYQEQRFEIMNGDAKGTKIIQNFKALDPASFSPNIENPQNSTTILTTTELRVTGILRFIANVVPLAYQSTISSVIDSMIVTTKNYESDSGKIIDEAYVEILGRHIDPKGVNYFVPLLESNELTIEELTELLINSEEKKLSLEVENYNIPISEISGETRTILNELYQEILYRELDAVSLQYYGSLLENKKISIEEIRELLINSEEKKYTIEPSKRKSIYELEDETRNLVNDVYKELLFRSADKYGLEFYGNLLESNKMTPEEFRQTVIESEEHKHLMRNVHDRAENRP